MKQRKLTEDYLRTIYVLSRQKGVHGSDLAKTLCVSRPTVSVTLKSLSEEGVIWLDQGRNIHLTERGLQIAQDIDEQNRFFLGLLTGLGIEAETAAREACEMEHCLSPESFSILKAALGQQSGN